MGRKANLSHVEATQLRVSGAGWIAALNKAKVPDTELARASVRKALRKLVTKADAEADAESTESAAYLRAKRKDLKARETAL